MKNQSDSETINARISESVELKGEKITNIHTIYYK